MCCSPGHYPENAGIFRTDITGHHHHYGGIVTLPDGNGHRHAVDDYCNLESGQEDDHWHANMPLKLTACIDNNGPQRFTLRAHDWFKYERETSMGIDRGAHPFYAGGWRGGDLGRGYDFMGTFYCTDRAQRDDVREQVIMAIAEGCEISDIALRKAVARFEGVQLKVHLRGVVARLHVPTLEEWQRGNPFVKPPLNDNDLLYGSDMDGFTMSGHAANASGLFLPEGVTDFDAYDLPDFDALAKIEHAVRDLGEFRSAVEEAPGRKPRVNVPTPSTHAQLQARSLKFAKARARNEPKVQGGLF